MCCRVRSELFIGQLELLQRVTISYLSDRYLTEFFNPSKPVASFFGSFFSNSLNDLCLSIHNFIGRGHQSLCQCTRHAYTCQLFLRYRREIFILGVLGFLNTRFPKQSEVLRRRPKSSEDVRSLHFQSQSQDAYKRVLVPSAFQFKNQRSRGRYCHLFILHMVCVPYTGLS